MTTPRGQRIPPGSKSPIARPGGVWLDPSRDIPPEHTCPLPAATAADYGRRWRCHCGSTWRAYSVDRPDVSPWVKLPPNPGRLGEQGQWGTVDDPKPRRRWWHWLAWGDDRGIEGCGLCACTVEWEHE